VIPGARLVNAFELDHDEPLRRLAFERFDLAATDDEPSTILRNCGRYLPLIFPIGLWILDVDADDYVARHCRAL
jgi:hypothetical protein